MSNILATEQRNAFVEDWLRMGAGFNILSNIFANLIIHEVCNSCTRKLYVFHLKTQQILYRIVTNVTSF